jgi:hypothetical protein
LPVKDGLLTIGIPHFDQIDQLLAVGHALQQIKVEHPQVDFLLSDNASPGITADDLKTYEAFANVRYFSENVGLVGNIERILQNSNTEWLWIMGAGDVPVLRNFARVLQFLEDAPKDVGLVHGGPYSHFPPLISLNIFRTETLLKISQQSQLGLRQYGEAWPHLDWSIEILEKLKQRALPLHIEVIVSRGDRDWHNTGRIFPLAAKLHEKLSSAGTGIVRPEDLKLAEDTLAAWFLQDRRAAKVGSLRHDLPTLLFKLRSKVFRSKVLWRVVLGLFPKRILDVAILIRRGNR